MAERVRTALVGCGGIVSAWLSTSTVKPSEVPVEPMAKSGHDGVIGEFIDCVRGGGVPETTAEDNIKSLAMVFGAIESAVEQCKVEVEA